MRRHVVTTFAKHTMGLHSPTMRAWNDNIPPVPPFPVLLAFLLALLAWRVGFIASMPFDLYPDEAQYWSWAQAPDWGYYSKPPMVAWMIAATTTLCGQEEFCIRIAAPFAHFFTALALYALGKHLADARAGALVAAVYATLPAVTLSSAIISTDAFLLLFWSLALLCFVKALDAPKPAPWWLGCGIAAGLGLLTKYSMGIFALSGFVFLVSSASGRGVLRSPWPYVGAALAFLIFLPNLLWNFDNGLVTLLHTRDNAEGGGLSFRPDKALEFLGAQAGVAGPIVFCAVTWAAWRARAAWQNESLRLLLCFTLPFLAIITCVAFFSRAHANWAAPAWAAGAALTVFWLGERGRAGWIRAALALHVLIAAVFVNYHDVMQLANIAPSRHNDPFLRVQGWRNLGEQVSEIWKDHPGTTLLTMERKDTATLLYYVTPQPFGRIVKWDADGKTQDHYDLTTTMRGKKGRDFLLVTALKLDPAVRRSFGTITHLTRLSIPLTQDFTRRYDVYLLQDFQGYR